MSARLTRTATLLFTDLVDSTLLLSRHGEEFAEQLRREHVAVLREAIEAHHGHEVKNLGDGLMVAFDGASDAIASAITMQQGVHHWNQTNSADTLAIRIGISSGDVDVADDDYFGKPVVEAARLCAAATGGQILVAELTRLLAGSRGGHVFEPVGSLELKGLEEPVVTSAVAWSPVVRGRLAIPIPPRIAAIDNSLFFGRDEELALIEETRKWVGAERRRRLVMIGGEPGIGKTALAAYAAHRAYDDGAIVLYGRTDEALNVPYQPWVEAIGHLLAASGDALVDGLDGGHRHALATIVPGLAVSDVRASTDPETERYLLFGAVVALLASASSVEPVVLVLDDLQWADAPSLQLLRHLAASAEPMRLLVLGTYRESEVTSSHGLGDLLEFLHREDAAERVSLRGLRDVDLLALMESAAGQTADADMVALRDSVLAETDGNPFFAGELLRHLTETGALVREGDHWVVSGELRAAGLPVSVREVVERRAARLGDKTVRVLTMAAVVGRDFDLDVVADALDEDPDGIVDALDAAVGATLVRNVEGDHFTFVHALVGHALYDSLTPARRSRAHRRVAEAIEAAVGDDPGTRVGELASHWARASAPEGAEKALRYAKLAGDRALALLAPDEACRWYDEALALLEGTAGDPRLRCEILVALGDAQRQSGVPAHRETLLAAAQLAQELDASDLLVRAALANNRGFFSSAGEVDRERVAVLEVACAAVVEADAATHARLLGQLASELVFANEPERWREIADAALAEARRADDPATLVAVLNALQQPTTPDTVERRATECAEALSVARELGDPVLEYWSAANSALVAFQRCDGEGVERATALHRAIADRLRQPTVCWQSGFLVAGRAIAAGDLEDAEARAERTLARGLETGQPDAMNVYAAELFAIRGPQGRMHELVGLLEDATQSSTIRSWRAVLAHTYCLTDRLDDARTVIDPDARDGFPYPMDSTWLPGMMYAARVVALVGAAEQQAYVVDRLTPFRDQFEFLGPASAGPVALPLAVLEASLGRDADADDDFARAIAHSEELGAALFATEARISWAVALVARGTDDARHRARELLAAALPVARERGYDLFVRQADAAVSALGG